MNPIMNQTTNHRINAYDFRISVWFMRDPWWNISIPKSHLRERVSSRFELRNIRCGRFIPEDQPSNFKRGRPINILPWEPQKCIHPRWNFICYLLISQCDKWSIIHAPVETWRYFSDTHFLMRKYPKKVETFAIHKMKEYWMNCRLSSGSYWNT